MQKHGQWSNLKRLEVLLRLGWALQAHAVLARNLQKFSLLWWKSVCVSGKRLSAKKEFGTAVCWRHFQPGDAGGERQKGQVSNTQYFSLSWSLYFCNYGHKVYLFFLFFSLFLFFPRFAATQVLEEHSSPHSLTAAGKTRVKECSARESKPWLPPLHLTNIELAVQFQPCVSFCRSFPDLQG